MATTTWAPSSSWEKYHLSAGAPSRTPSELASVPSPADGAAAEGRLLSPSNPLLIFGLLAAATFGLMAASTTVRVGKARATVSVGTT